MKHYHQLNFNILINNFVIVVIIYLSFLFYCQYECFNQYLYLYLHRFCFFSCNCNTLYASFPCINKDFNQSNDADSKHIFYLYSIFLGRKMNFQLVFAGNFFIYSGTMYLFKD